MTQPSREVVLASTSPYRRRLLERLVSKHDVVAPNVDEGAYKTQNLPPVELARVLSIAKAEAVASFYPDALIISGDQVAELDGEILSKPGTVEKAIDQLTRLSGNTHRLITAMTVRDSRTSTMRTHVETHKLTIRSLTQRQIEAYVAIDSPLNCGGSYRIESVGISLFERIEGSDPSAIEGLPLMALSRILASFDLDVLTIGHP